MFKETDTNFIRSLVRLLKPQVLLQGDFAFRYGEVGDTMYFVQSGIVQVGNEGFSTVYATLGRGKYFGELALFTAQRRTASARAVASTLSCAAELYMSRDIRSDTPRECGARRRGTLLLGCVHSE